MQGNLEKAAYPFSPLGGNGSDQSILDKPSTGINKGRAGVVLAIPRRWTNKNEKY